MEHGDAGAGVEVRKARTKRIKVSSDSVNVVAVVRVVIFDSCYSHCFMLHETDTCDCFYMLAVLGVVGLVPYRSRRPMGSSLEA